MDQVGYFGVFLATVIESFFPPIPSEIVLFTAGFYANSHGGLWELTFMALVAAFGNFVGTLPFYLVARYSANDLLPKLLDRWGAYLLITRADLENSQKYFHNRGAITVILARMVPGIRSLIAFPAGFSKMPFLQYTFYTMIGSFAWNIFMGGVGYWVFDYKDQVLAVLDPLSNFILIAVVLAAIAYALRVAWQIHKLRISQE